MWATSLKKSWSRLRTPISYNRIMVYNSGADALATAAADRRQAPECVRAEVLAQAAAAAAYQSVVMDILAHRETCMAALFPQGAAAPGGDF